MIVESEVMFKVRAPPRVCGRACPSGHTAFETLCPISPAISPARHVAPHRAAPQAMPAMGEAEEDMLDLAVGVKPLSRLGCQVFAAPELDGLTVVLPAEVASQLAR